MSLTRHTSTSETKRYDHGINIRSVYYGVLNARYSEMFKSVLPDQSSLDTWNRTLVRLTPPLPVMAEKHAIATRQIARWNQILAKGQE